MNNGETKNNFPLVRRPSSAIEKAAPGAKRILSGMVADTLALAKPVFTVLMCDDQISEIVELLIKTEWNQKFTLRFIRFSRTTELLKLVREQSFDLLFLYVGNVQWDTFIFDYPQAAEFLAELKAQYGKPIIATQGLDLRKSFEATDVTFIQAPFSVEEFRDALKANFPAQLSKTRPLRIVVVNDEEGPIESIKIILLKWFNKDAVVLTFYDSEKAWEELLRTPPDLLITDDIMPVLGGMEIVRRLADRKAAYPVILTTSFERSELDVCVRDCVNRGLKIKLLDVPFDIESFLKVVEDSLKIQRAKAEPDIQTTPVVADTDLESWYQTGDRYYFGRGVPKDYTEAIKWYRKAADHGHAMAQNSVGVCYERALGISQDYKEAAKWYRKAAEQGDAYAQNNLGACYINGRGVLKDYAEAVKWYRLAADQGNELAKTNLGLLNEKGGLDNAEALESLRNMAVQGYAPAQYRLGIGYRDGQNLLKDLAEAYKWLKLASEHPLHTIGNSIQELALLSSTMTQDDLAEGERRYHEFRIQRK